MTKMTQEKMNTLAWASHDNYDRSLKNYQPAVTHTLQQHQLTYSNYPVTVVCYDSLPQQYIDKLQAQLLEAESRGYKSRQPMVLFLHEFTCDDNIGGGMTPMGEMLDGGGLVATMGLNTNSTMSGVRNPQGEQATLEHEFWHLIDYAGDHSNTWSQPIDLADHDPDTSDAVLDNLREEMGRGALSVGMIVRTLKNVELETFREYSDQPHELWVHHRMCETAGLAPRSIEGYHLSHNILFNVMGYLNSLPQVGVSRSACRKAAQQFSLEISNRKRFLEEMRICGYGWLFS